MDRPRCAPNVGGGEGDAPAAPSVALPPNRAETTPPPDPEAREQSALAPLQICGRWVSGRRLQKFAGWLAVARLKFAHVSRDRVAWRFAHSRNFAWRALRRGYRAEAIEAAYRFGVDASDENARDALMKTKIALAHRGSALGADFPREPSEAVCYAWRKLRADDPRDDTARWSEFFAAPRRPRDPKVAKVRAENPASVQKNTPEETTGPDAEKRAGSSSAVARLRAQLGGLEQQQAADNAALPITARELIAWLALRELTLASFQQLPWTQRKKMLARAVEWAKEKREAG